MLTQYYSDKSRQIELDTCLEKNIRNSHIEHIHLLVEHYIKNKLVHNHKVSQTVISERLRYNHAFEFSNQYLEGKICILANADIYFDETLDLAKNIGPHDIYALARYEATKNGQILTPFYRDHRYTLKHKTPDGFVLCPFAHCSQDVWVYKAPLPKMDSDIPLGVPACDNRIAHELRKKGLTVTNPCLDIIARHLHTATSHNYDEADKIHGPTFYPEPSKLKPNK